MFEENGLYAIDLSNLIKGGFFPKELPPPFNTHVLADYFDSNPPIAPTKPGGGPFITRPAIHNLARPGGRRRRLHIPNPFGYYKLCALLDSQAVALEKHVLQSELSVSVPSLDPKMFRAAVPRVDGGELAIERARVRGAARFLLRTDISRFYGSIYTHSIPWALVGKTKAKQRRKGGLANDLDAAFRELQDGQTLGIPIGPDASFITAEIIASAIDKQMQSRGLTKGMRFMDDYEFGFDSRSSAEAALSMIEEILAEFELAINPRKTSIEQLPVELDRPWRAEIRSYDFDEERVAGPSEIVTYFNRVFELKSLYPSDAVLAYAVARLRSVKVDDWNLLQNLICQCALSEPGATEPVVTLLQENIESELSEAIDGLINSTISYHSPLSHGSEAAWALWAAVWFKRKISNEAAKELLLNRDPVVAILALHAKELGLISKSVSFQSWGDLIDADSLYGSDWLLAYEADRNGWLTGLNKGKFVERDPNFSKLKDADVIFYNPEIEAPTRSLLFEYP
jgi:hypothetical protein